MNEKYLKNIAKHWPLPSNLTVSFLLCSTVSVPRYRKNTPYIPTSSAFARMETSVTSLSVKSKILVSVYIFSTICAAVSALSAEIFTLFSEMATSVISYCFMKTIPLSYRSIPLSRTHSFALKSAPTKWSASRIYWLLFQLSSAIYSASARLSASMGTVICRVSVTVTSYAFISHGSFRYSFLPAPLS